MTRTATGAAQLGIGLAAVGRPAYITPRRSADLGHDRAPDELERRTHALLDAAVAGGITYVDVARSYGRAEEFVASWLARRADDAAVRAVEVGSKWGYRYVGDWRMDAEAHEVKDHSVDAFREQWPRSEELLGSHLGRYLVHSATLDTGALTDTALHRELARVRDRGVRVGISTSGAQQADAVRAALDVVVGGAPLFTAFQVTWNPLEPSVGAAAAEAAERGAQVVVKEVVANGRRRPGRAARRRPRRGGRRPGGPAVRRRRARPAVGVARALRRGHPGAPGLARRRVGRGPRPRRADRGGARRRGPRGLLGRPVGPRLDLTSRPSVLTLRRCRAPRPAVTRRSPPRHPLTADQDVRTDRERDEGRHP